MTSTPRLLLAFLLALVAPVAKLRAETADAEVRAEFSRWMEAYRKHDLAGTMAIFDPAVRFAFQGAPDVGYAELQRGYEQEFKGPGATAVWEGTIDEVIASGGLAAEYSTWRLVDRGPGGGRKVLAHNRGVDLFRRNARGEWRIIRSMNYPVTPPPPGH